MINTVRARIIAAIKTGIAAAGSGRVGRVIMPGGDVSAISSTLSLEKFVVEVFIGDDEKGAPRPNIEEQTFDVGLVIHMPQSELAGKEPSEVAADINGDLYQVYAADETVGQWGGLAMKSELLAFGDVYLSDGGTIITVQGFSVTYRFKRGNPAEAR